MTKAKLKARIIFPDGKMYEAASWSFLEYTLRQEGWNPSNDEKFRAAMATRAEAWSNSYVDVELISKQFFEDLEAANMLMIVRDDETQG